METWNINGHTLEYIDDGHIYVYEGEVIPSITQAMKVRFGKKYEGIDKATLQRASDMGTAIHKAIEEWCKTGAESDYQEVRNFKFLLDKHEMKTVNNEVPVILYKDGEALLAGRLDLVIKSTKNGCVGLADIKRTSTLDKEYLGYQLNLYRIAYQQCYGDHISFLRGIHLREDIRKMVNIPINEKLAWDLVNEWRNQNGDL